MPSPPPPTDQPPSQQQRTLNDTPVEVAVIGSGVCGVLAAAALRQRDGARVRVLEASPAGAGGVWRTTANHYSTLQVSFFVLFLFLHSLFGSGKEKREGNAVLLEMREKKKKEKKQDSPVSKNKPFSFPISSHLHLFLSPSLSS
jgi:protoporphyrinogen oxidase